MSGCLENACVRTKGNERIVHFFSQFFFCGLKNKNLVWKIKLLSWSIGIINLYVLMLNVCAEVAVAVYCT